MLIAFVIIYSAGVVTQDRFLAHSLSGPTHPLIWVVRTDVAFYFMPGAQQQTYVYCWLHWHPHYYPVITPLLPYYYPIITLLLPYETLFNIN
jgi:hypothetical protein